MDLNEACSYMGVSPDDEDLDINKVEKYYKTGILVYDLSKFSPNTENYKKAEKMRRKIEEAHDYLLGVYAELYGSQEEYEQDNDKNSCFLTVLTLSMTVIAAVCLLGLTYFIYVNFDEKSLVKNTTNYIAHEKNYENLLREIEELKNKIEVQNTPTTPSKTPVKDNYADLVEKVMPSMVLIQTDKAQGSGFFVSSNGDVLTNYHVIKDAEYIKVTTYENEKVFALIKGFDYVKDMALLKITLQKSTPFLELYNDSLPLRQGEAVIAIGNPRGLGWSVSNGIVSAFRNFDDNAWVQFTAPVSQGSSGGALVDLQGKVVGMITAGRTDGQNLNFAVAFTELGNFLWIMNK